MALAALVGAKLLEHSFPKKNDFENIIYTKLFRLEDRLDFLSLFKFEVQIFKMADSGVALSQRTPSLSLCSESCLGLKIKSFSFAKVRTSRALNLLNYKIRKTRKFTNPFSMKPLMELQAVSFKQLKFIND